MSARHRIQALLAELKPRLRPAAEQQLDRKGWDLNLPITVIDARRSPALLIPTSLGTINSILKVSMTIAAPSLQPFFALLGELAWDEAYERCAADPQQGALFVEAFEAYREEKAEQGQAMWSLDDSTAFVLKSRECFDDAELPLVALLPADSSEGAEIFTFGVPLRYFLDSSGAAQR